MCRIVSLVCWVGCQSICGWFVGVYCVMWCVIPAEHRLDPGGSNHSSQRWYRSWFRHHWRQEHRRSRQNYTSRRRSRQGNVLLSASVTVVVLWYGHRSRKDESDWNIIWNRVLDLPMRPSGQRTRPPCAVAVEHDTLSGRGSRLSPGALPKNY